jgi:hypothetical protein
MAYMAIHFVDPTIPGISGRDLVRRAGAALDSTLGFASKLCAAPRCARWLRQDLADLDRHQLRDIGLDRSAV